MWLQYPDWFHMVLLLFHVIRVLKRRRRFPLLCDQTGCWESSSSASLLSSGSTAKKEEVGLTMRGERMTSGESRLVWFKHLEMKSAGGASGEM